MANHVDTLMGCLLAYAPNSLCREKCHKMLAEAMADGNRGPALELIIAQAMVDGLRFGNWPWTPFPHYVPRERGVQIGDFNVQHNNF